MSPRADVEDTWALALTRFLAGGVFAVLFQLPATLYLDNTLVQAWFISVLMGALLTGFLCLSLPKRAWEPTFAYAFLAAIVLFLFVGRAGVKSLPMFGALFGSWSLLATAFAFHILRQKKSPPTS